MISEPLHAFSYSYRLFPRGEDKIWSETVISKYFVRLVSCWMVFPWRSCGMIGIFRTAPKYCVILGFADYLRSSQIIASLYSSLMNEEDYGLEELPRATISQPLHSFAIALTSSFVGAVLTNPLDVIIMEYDSFGFLDPHIQQESIIWITSKGNLIGHQQIQFRSPLEVCHIDRWFFDSL